MSHLFRWVRQNRTLASQTVSMLAGRQGSAASAIMNYQTIKPLYQIPTAPITTSAPLLQAKPNEPNGSNSNQGKGDTGYTIKVKTDTRNRFKELYTLYGPLFIASHIFVSLCSLGFFCTLVFFSVDLESMLSSTWFFTKVTDKMMTYAESGGKFVIAYAIHKVLLPFRLFGAISLTKFLGKFVHSGRIKWPFKLK